MFEHTSCTLKLANFRFSRVIKHNLHPLSIGLTLSKNHRTSSRKMIDLTLVSFAISRNWNMYQGSIRPWMVAISTLHGQDFWKEVVRFYCDAEQSPCWATLLRSQPAWTSVKSMNIRIYSPIDFTLKMKSLVWLRLPTCSDYSTIAFPQC